MPSLIQRVAETARYGLTHGTRLAWFAGQGYAMRQVMERAQARDPSLKKPIKKPDGPVPDQRRMLTDIAALMQRDLANAQNGLYPFPEPGDTWPRRIAQSRAFFRDLPNVARRRADNRHQEVFTEATKGTRPRYYLQNFHFQSDGWMSSQSAKIYDTQVEILFLGATEVMRRQGLVPIASWMHGRDQRRLVAVDLATGPGNFARELARTYPKLPILATDLSEPYIAEARRRLPRHDAVRPFVANAEAVPLRDRAADLLTSVYLFHELPHKVRANVAVEAARLLKPGGLFVVVDSLRAGDDPDYDGLLRIFPQLFHEPYFENYLANPIEPTFEAAGFRLVHSENAFVSKVLAFERV